MKSGRHGIDRLKKNGLWRAMGIIDPKLRGVKAFNQPAVHEWHKWILTRYMPRHDTILLTPCSNRKPYPKSSQSGKIRSVLMRNGLWDMNGLGYKGSPNGLEWIYLSDLLLLVPYERAMEYPACCYDLPPDIVLGDPQLFNRVKGMLSQALERLRGRRIIAYLPSKHYKILKESMNGAANNLILVKYHLFHGHKHLEETIIRTL